MAKHEIVFASKDTEINRLEELVCNIMAANPPFAPLEGLIYACVEELLVNCIKHGNKYNPAKKVVCHYSIENRVLEFTLEDEGEGFDIEEVERIIEAKGKEREDGRGMIIARSVSDFLKYDNGGRRVRVQFKEPAAN